MNLKTSRIKKKLTIRIYQNDDYELKIVVCYPQNDRVSSFNLQLKLTYCC